MCKLIAYARSLAGLAACILATTLCLADTPDLTENLSNIGTPVCAGNASGIFADVDGNGVNDTMVVFNTIQGEAFAEYAPSSPFGFGFYDYFYSQAEVHCGHSPYTTTGKFAIWFVDMLASGFVATDSTTWTYKSVSGVNMYVFCGAPTSGETTPYSTWYHKVTAYTERFQGGTLIGSYSETEPQIVSNGSGLNCHFTSTSGVKEIYLYTDFTEMAVLYFSIISGSSADIGMRAFDGSNVIKLGAEASGTLTSPFRINKNGTSYGLVLVATNSPDASRFRIQTASGVKSLQKLP